MEYLQELKPTKGTSPVSGVEPEKVRVRGKWRTKSKVLEPCFPVEQITDFINFKAHPLYKDKVFLHQKYIVEGLSTAQIASQIFSSQEAVRANLVRFEIPLREAHRHHGRPSRPKYGQKKQNGKVVTHLAEKRVIEAVLDMRRQKLSLRQIARFLTKIGVPTKQRGVSWHPQMVKRLLASIDQQDSKSVSHSDVATDPSRALKCEH